MQTLDDELVQRAFDVFRHKINHEEYIDSALKDNFTYDQIVFAMEYVKYYWRLHNEYSDS